MIVSTIDPGIALMFLTFLLFIWLSWVGVLFAMFMVQNWVV